MVFRDDDDDLRLGRTIGGREQTAPAGRRFAILRCAKIKTLGNMGASLQHTFRERETPNADPARRIDNTVLIGGTDSAAVLDAWRDRAPEKIRANAVHGLEYFVGGSPEALKAMSRDQQDAYFRDALDWLKARHGTENILSAVIHRDETTPHMTVMTIPLDQQGKLNARAIVGSRQKLSAMQTDFAKEVAQAHGLERGLKGSTATHERVRRVYAHITDPDASVRLPERHRGAVLGLGGESDADWRHRAAEAATDALRGVQAARHRETRDHAVEVFSLRQQITGTPAMQREIDRLEMENRALRKELVAVNAEADQLGRNLSRVEIACDTVVTYARSLMQEHGIAEKPVIAQLNKVIEAKIKESEAPAVQEVPAAKPSAPKPEAKLTRESAIEVVQEKPAVQIQDEPIAEHRITPKDDAWDDGH